MDSKALARFEAMLANGQDNALLRLSLGQGYLAAGDHRAALEHLARAVELQPDYSAAWKFLGKAFASAGDPGSAAGAFRRGIEVAAARGDQQLVREMKIFLRRIEKSDPGR